MEFFKPSLTIILLTILFTVALYPLITGYVFALALGSNSSFTNQLFAWTYPLATPLGSYLFLCICRFVTEKMKQQKNKKH